MGNTCPTATWRVYAREQGTAVWLPTPLWGLVVSEAHSEDVILSCFRHDVYRYAMGTHHRFHAVYLYNEGVRQIKCQQEPDGALVLEFHSAALRTTWCSESTERSVHDGPTQRAGSLFAAAWQRDTQQETPTRLRWIPASPVPPFFVEERHQTRLEDPHRHDRGLDLVNGNTDY